MNVFKRVALLCKPHAKYAVIGFVFLIAANATRLIAPRITGWLVDDVIEGGNESLLIPLCIALLGLTVLRSVSNYVRGSRL